MNRQPRFLPDLIGVKPNTPGVSTLAPSSASSITTFTRPVLEATQSSDCSSMLCQSTLAPRSTKARAMRLRERSNAHISAGSSPSINSDGTDDVPPTVPETNAMLRV